MNLILIGFSDGHICFSIIRERSVYAGKFGFLPIKYICYYYNPIHDKVFDGGSRCMKSLMTCHFDTDNLPFELRALELALELICSSLDAQVI